MYETRVRLPWTEIQAYLSEYARWYFPVDQKPGSGRKLLSVLVREFGDDSDLVFLYWYEDPGKAGYYAKYARAFFDYHSQPKGKTYREFLDAYQAARADLGRDADQGFTGVFEEFQTGTEAPLVALETLGKVDARLHGMLVGEEDSWNLSLNPCYVMELTEGSRHGAGEKGRPRETVVKEMKDGRCPRTLLEEVVSTQGSDLPVTKTTPVQ